MHRWPILTLVALQNGLAQYRIGYRGVTGRRAARLLHVLVVAAIVVERVVGFSGLDVILRVDRAHTVRSVRAEPLEKGAIHLRR